MKSHSMKRVLMSEDGGLLLIILLTTIGAWFAPDNLHYRMTLTILCLGVFFDLISLVAHVSTFIRKKYYSGFRGVGGFFYCWFIISSRFSLVGSGKRHCLASSCSKWLMRYCSWDYTYCASRRCAY